jgi:exopolyphosphatase/guanosine-5'-triphosphate,3'-diphosphate pyrophosphatase
VLVVDIGGGSTELIIGEGFEHKALTSRKMGCVSFTQSFWQRQARREGLQRRRVEASTSSPPSSTSTASWAGRAASAARLHPHRARRVAGEEWTDGAITLAGLERLKEEMLKHKRVDQLAGGPHRGASGGVRRRGGHPARALHLLPIERMEYSDGALREGLLYEFEERLQHHDIRERTALALSTTIASTSARPPG